MVMVVPHEMRMVFFFNDTATTEIYTLSLHDALPISHAGQAQRIRLDRARHSRRCIHGAARWARGAGKSNPLVEWRRDEDRKSTRLNSSHANISYAVFCLKKKKTPIALTALYVRRVQL